MTRLLKIPAFVIGYEWCRSYLFSTPGENTVNGFNLNFFGFGLTIPAWAAEWITLNWEVLALGFGLPLYYLVVGIPVTRAADRRELFNKPDGGTDGFSQFERFLFFAATPAIGPLWLAYLIVKWLIVKPTNAIAVRPSLAVLRWFTGSVLAAKPREYERHLAKAQELNKLFAGSLGHAYAYQALAGKLIAENEAANRFELPKKRLNEEPTSSDTPKPVAREPKVGDIVEWYPSHANGWVPYGVIASETEWIDVYGSRRLIKNIPHDFNCPIRYVDPMTYTPAVGDLVVRANKNTGERDFRGAIASQSLDGHYCTELSGYYSKLPYADKYKVWLAYPEELRATVEKICDPKESEKVEHTV